MGVSQEELFGPFGCGVDSRLGERQEMWQGEPPEVAKDSLG